MAKNTFSSAFRKIDVDKYNEDNFKEDVVEDGAKDTKIDEKEIQNLLSSNNAGEALKRCLINAPLMSKNQQLKDNAMNLTLRVLLSIKATQIEGIVSSLDEDHLDVLMKYIYRGFENPSEGSSGHLLNWHEKVFARGGVGTIVRVLSDSARA